MRPTDRCVIPNAYSCCISNGDFSFLFVDDHQHSTLHSHAHTSVYTTQHAFIPFVLKTGRFQAGPSNCVAAMHYVRVQCAVCTGTKKHQNTREIQKREKKASHTIASVHRKFVLTNADAKMETFFLSFGLFVYTQCIYASRIPNDKGKKFDNDVIAHVHIRYSDSHTHTGTQPRHVMLILLRCMLWLARLGLTDVWYVVRVYRCVRCSAIQTSKQTIRRRNEPKKENTLRNKTRAKIAENTYNSTFYSSH